MKKITTLLIFLFLSGLISVVIGQNYQITGVLSYHNDASKLLEDCIIELRDYQHKKVDDFVTGQDGEYEFTGLSNGTYYVCVIDVAYNWGGNNTTDAMLIAQHIAQTITLTGFEALAADCMKLYNQIDNNDWVAVCSRFVHLINEFDRTLFYSDWVINEEYTVIINGADETQDLETICYGDVNSSYTP